MEKKLKNINIRVDEDFKKSVDKVSSELGTTTSSFIRIAAIEKLNRIQKEGK